MTRGKGCGHAQCVHMHEPIEHGTQPLPGLTDEDTGGSGRGSALPKVTQE